MDDSAKGKVGVVKDIIKLSQKAKIEKPLIDVATEAFGIYMGPAARAIHLIKSSYGYPVGIGTGNVATTFYWAKTNVSKEARYQYPHLRGRHDLLSTVAHIGNMICDMVKEKEDGTPSD